MNANVANVLSSKRLSSAATNCLVRTLGRSRATSKIVPLRMSKRPATHRLAKVKIFGHIASKLRGYVRYKLVGQHGAFC